MSDAAEEITDDITDDVTFEWPENWQQEIAGDDEKQLQHLSKYKTPADIWTKARALEQKLSSGEYKQNTPFPTEGSDEDKAAWRKEQGLPDTATGYELVREIGDDEKDTVNAFMEYAYERNMSPQNVNDMLDYFYTRKEQDDELAAEGDATAQQNTDDALRAEWGNDYRGNINRVDNLIATAPAEVAEILLDARLPNGDKLRANPDAMRFLLDMATLMDPITTVTDSKGTGKLTAVQDELDSIREVMRTDRAKYNRDERMQQRYRELIAAEQKLTPQK